MVELYCSWCKGLPESTEALKLIKESELFAGIELSNTDGQADKILEAGLKVSIHNPIREFKMTLDNEKFIQVLNTNPKIIDSCNKSSLSFVSFHTNYIPSLDRTIPYSRVLKNTVKNLNELDTFFSKQILFETSCGFGENEYLPFSESMFNCTSPDFAKKILSKTNSGVLIDISHVISSASAHKLYNNYPKGVKDFFLDYLDACAKRTYELHLNSTKLNENGFYKDTHSKFVPTKKETQLAFECATQAINSCPKLEIVVLEIEPKLEPIAHAKLMIKQAQLFVKTVKF